MSGVVVELYVHEGSPVQVGDKLFKIDDREQQAQLIPALAKVPEIAARLAQAKSQFELANSLLDKRAISVEELNNRRFAVQLAEAEHWHQPKRRSSKYRWILNAILYVH